MAVTYFPFNSIVIDGVPDRPANAANLAAYLAGFFSNGVLLQTETALQVTPAGGMDVQIAIGVGNINGKTILNDAAEIVKIEAANATLDRIDRIVFRLDEPNRRMMFDVLKGTPASSPTAPAITQSADIYELCLAEIRIPAGATSITSSYITDTRKNPELCGAANIPKHMQDIEHGGTGADNADEAVRNLGAAGLNKQNIFKASQILGNGVYLFGLKSDGYTNGLIGISKNDNLIIGDTAQPDRPVNLYGVLNLSSALGLSEGGAGRDLSSIPDGAVIAKGASALSYWSPIPAAQGGTGRTTGAATVDHTHTSLANGDAEIMIANSSSPYYFRPRGNIYDCHLGGSSYRWGTVYCVAVNESSDMRLKEDIDTDFDKYIAMLDALTPKSYLRTDDKNEVRKRNTGYIAQDVWKAMQEAGLKKEDFAGFSMEMQEEGSVYTYGLLYTQFIPILHAKIKRQEEAIKNLTEKVKELEQKIS